MMFWKVVLGIEILAGAFTIPASQDWRIPEIVTGAMIFLRIFAVYTYAFNQTRYSTTSFWGAFRYVFVGWVLLAVYGFITGFTSGFEFGIFPTIDVNYILWLLTSVVALVLFTGVEWTVITRLSRGLTARTHASNSQD